MKRQHEVEMTDRVPCPNPHCSGGEVAIPGMREVDTGAPILVTCGTCRGAGTVPPILLDPIFDEDY